MNVVRCTKIGCECHMKDTESFNFPPLGAKAKCDCGHDEEDHVELHEGFQDIWFTKVFPLILRQDQKALRVTCKEYQDLKLGSKHRDFYRPCDICHKRIRKRHLENTPPTGAVGIQVGGKYVHFRCSNNA